MITAEEMLNDPPTLVAVDIETVSLVDRRLIGFGIATSPTDAYYFPWGVGEDKDDAPILSLRAMWHVVENPAIRKIYHNGLFDMQILMDYGEPDLSNIEDTSIMAQLLGCPLKLKDLAHGLQVKDIKEISDVLPRKSTMLDLPLETVASKCMDDVMATFGVWEKMAPHIYDWEYYQRELDMIPLLIKMSRRGLLLDPQRVLELEKQYAEDVDYYKAMAEGHIEADGTMMGFNPGSPQQVGMVLTLRKNRLPIKESYKAYDTGSVVLSDCEDPIAALTLAYRKGQKLLGTYIRPLKGKDRIYTHFHMRTATGRLASSDKNLQNVPLLMRDMCLPDSNIFTSADYSQQELRIMAHLSGDKEMLYCFENGISIHQNTADAFGIAYKTAKNTTFAMGYGGQPETIMETAGIKSRQLAKELRDKWFRLYNGAADWIEEVAHEGLRLGRVQTIMGRWLYLPDSSQEDEAGIKRKAVNYTIQGSAADITKAAMLKCKDLPIALQIHDELVFDGRVEKEELQQRGLENDVAPWRMPIEVKYSGVWQ